MAIRSVSRLIARPLRTSRPVTALVALATLCVVAVATPALAAPGPHAKPKPTIGDLQKQLGELAMKNSQLVEKYDQARVTATKAAKAAKTAKAASTAAAGRYAIARQRYVEVIEDQYQNSGLGAASALLESTSNSDYLDRLSSLSMVSDHMSGVVAAVAKVRSESISAAKSATTAAATAKAAQKSINTERTNVQSQISKYKKMLATLTSQQQAAYQRAQDPKVTNAKISGLNFKNPAVNPRAYKAVQFALAQVNKPYVWGASGPSSYDCSGLTMASWAHAGVSLPHSAAEQYNYGTHVSVNDLQPGDLLFYYSPIGHVTIYAGDGMMVSAPTEGEDVTVVPVAAYSSDFVGATRL